MTSRAYYNENDPYAAQWLRNLIAAGHIAPGEVDDRSIEDVKPDDLRGFTQCHFFAGLAGWSFALGLAGWGEREVWTGSCPCQPFSNAGKRKGAADKRHLWPSWFRLIRERKPAVILGEQVARAIGYSWYDAVAHDLEGEGYAVGAAVLPACAVNAPHRRDRLWFVADTKRDQQSRQEPCGGEVGRMGRLQQSMAWDRPWSDALAAFRALDDGLPRSVGATDAARNAIVPQVAASFVTAYLEARASLSLQDAA